MISLFKYILVCISLAFVTFSASAGECKKTGQVCVEGAATKNIGGHQVYRACWKYEDTYTCIKPNAVDYCSGIASTPGCNITSSVCNGLDHNGECLSYTNTYRCGDSLAPATGVVKLDDTYTVVFDETDRSACDTYANNPSCTMSSKTCTDGPGTKVINGLPVHKECWEWKENYSCVAQNAVDYCTPLKEAGCAEHSKTCKVMGTLGQCVEYEYTFLCGDAVQPLPAEIVLLEETYSVISEGQNNEQCIPYENNPNCTVAGTTCVDGPGTKTIDGEQIFRECWEWRKDFTCNAAVPQSTCEELQNNDLCTETGSQCVQNLPNGQCGLVEHQYKCATSSPTETTKTDCGLQTFCVDGKCFDTGYKPDGDFGQTIAVMELARQASWYDIFKGEANTCSKTALANCCKSKGGGQGGRNDAIAREAGAAVFKLAAEEIYVWGSQYVYEGLMASGSAMLQEMAGSMAAGGFTGSFSVWGAEFAVAADGAVSFVGFDPWSLVIAIAIYVIMELMSCDEDEVILQMKKGQSLCTHVGSWCATEVLGSCLKKKESYCCYPSKLGRIVNEQGRAQIGKGYGPDEEHPDCSGFSTEELGQLRFDEMDLSEFVADIPQPTKSPNFAKQRLDQKAKSYYAP